MLHIAICEDDQLQLAFVKDTVEQVLSSQPIHVAAYGDGYELIDVIESRKKQIDIAILDIELNDSLSGIDIARRLNQNSPQTQIVFISAHITYAPELYSTDHIYFVLKPINQNKLEEALQKCIKKIEQLANDVLFVQVKGKTISIPLSDILYCISEQRIVRIVCKNYAYEIYAKLDDLETRMRSERFLRCHQSYLVNMEKIQKFEGKNVLVEGVELPVSSQRLLESRQKFYRFIGEL